MSKKSVVITILSLVMLLAMSGCFSNRYTLQHNPDGSGLLTFESIFNLEYLGLFDEGITMEEAKDEILADSVLAPEDLPDDPNIRSVTQDVFIDPATGALHHILTIEIIDILKPIEFEAPEAEDNTLFRVEDYGDGTFLFSTIIETVSEFSDEGFDQGFGDDFAIEPEGFELLMEGSTITWQIIVGEFIEADPLAKFDPASSTVSWEVPMYDVLFGEEPVQIFAIYRLDMPQVEVPPPDQVVTSIPEQVATAVEQPEQGSSGLPAWIPLTLVAVLCLGMIFAVIVIIVIILVVRSRNK